MVAHPVIPFMILRKHPAREMIGQIYKLLPSFNEAFVHLYDGPPDPEFVATRNLPTSDPRVAQAIMSAVARRSHRVARPAYRFRVFFDPSDRVSGEMMLEIAGEVLEGLGAGDLHAVFAGWTNAPSRFLYVVVNRVRPGTFTAWSPWWDMYRGIRSASTSSQAPHISPSKPSSARHRRRTWSRSSGPWRRSGMRSQACSTG